MIKIVEPYIMLIWFVGSLIVQMVYFLKDDRTENHTKEDLEIKKIWHASAGSIHIWGGVMLGIHYGWEMGVFTSAITWLFFDGALNTWVLKKEWFYIGTTAQIDIAQRRIAAWFSVTPQLLSGVLKGLFLLGSTINLFIA